MLMPMQAVADDSGCKGQGAVVVIAGLVGRAEWWGDFADKWDTCLKESPSIRYFKMYEAARLNGQFARLSKRQRDAKLIALVEVLNSHPFEELYITVDIAAHAKMFGAFYEGRPAPRKKNRTQHEKDEATLGNPYFYAYDCFISAACFNLWEAGEREPFEFIVDEHPSLGERVKRWYPVVRTIMKEPFRDIMPLDPMPRNDEAFKPLQAADMLAGLQRMAAHGDNEFGWLRRHFTIVKPATRCVHMNEAWFEFIRSLSTPERREPMSTETMIQLARMQGAPIPAEGEPWPKKPPSK
jgi:hypothetical protein